MTRFPFSFLVFCACFAAASWLVIVEPDLPRISAVNAANILYLVGFFSPFLARSIKDFPLTVPGVTTVTRTGVTGAICICAILLTMFGAVCYAEFGWVYWSVFVQAGFAWIIVIRLWLGKSIYFLPDVGGFLIRILRNPRGSKNI
jgi:hypothetical protein